MNLNYILLIPMLNIVYFVICFQLLEQNKKKIKNCSVTILSPKRLLEVPKANRTTRLLIKCKIFLIQNQNLISLSSRLSPTIRNMRLNI